MRRAHPKFDSGMVTTIGEDGNHFRFSRTIDPKVRTDLRVDHLVTVETIKALAHALKYTSSAGHASWHVNNPHASIPCHSCNTHPNNAKIAVYWWNGAPGRQGQHVTIDEGHPCNVADACVVCRTVDCLDPITLGHTLVIHRKELHLLTVDPFKKEDET